MLRNFWNGKTTWAEVWFLWCLFLLMLLCRPAKGAEPRPIDPAVAWAWSTPSTTPAPTVAPTRLTTASGRVIEQRGGVWVYVDSAPEVTPPARPFHPGTTYPGTALPTSANRVGEPLPGYPAPAPYRTLTGTTAFAGTRGFTERCDSFG